MYKIIITDIDNNLLDAVQLELDKLNIYYDSIEKDIGKPGISAIIEPFVLQDIIDKLHEAQIYINIRCIELRLNDDEYYELHKRILLVNTKTKERKTEVNIYEIEQ